jgi:hypothetical protein
MDYVFLTIICFIILIMINLLVLTSYLILNMNKFPYSNISPIWAIAILSCKLTL